MQPQRTASADGRWHFQHGPIDLVIGADGEADAVAAAHAAAWARFDGLLQELVTELLRLREPVGRTCWLDGPVARRMWSACAPHAARFITPMAAVAGAVAQEIVGCYQRPGIHRAWVNNGGDIALHLAPGTSVSVGLYADLARLDARQIVQGLDLDGTFAVTADLPVRGIATSGWRGRSFSLGIADSVTVLAGTAAAADACATVIANAVDIADPRIERRPACEVADDSDLGRIEVTVDVPPLPAEAVATALEAGHQAAQALVDRGLVWAAILTCQGQVRHAGGGAGRSLSFSSPVPSTEGNP